MYKKSPIIDSLEIFKELNTCFNKSAVKKLKTLQKNQIKMNPMI